MSRDIRLSPKHGVNPSVTMCPCCGKDTGIALNGLMKGDAEAPRNMVDRGPCEKCSTEFEDFKMVGFVIFVISDEYDRAVAKDPKTPPWPFFHSLNVIKHEAAERMFENMDLSKGCAFMPLSVAKSIELVNQDGTIKPVGGG